jgi:hypothetical protein
MGYACPVCEDPQADAEHLANHLAFTAMLGDAEHEAWLETHAPDWDEESPADLAEIVADEAEEREFPQVFEDTTDGHDHDHGDGVAHHHARQQAPDPELDAQARQTLEDARRMTEQMRAADDEDDADENA